MRSIHWNIYSYVQCISELTPWLRIDKDSAQGDTSSRTLCNCCISPLLEEIKAHYINGKFGNIVLCLLHYTNNLAIIGDNEYDLLKLLKVTEDWCNRWRLKLNTTKSYVIHFRKLRKPTTIFEFKINNNRLDLVNSCKYLGVIFNEHLNYHDSVDACMALGDRKQV